MVLINITANAQAICGMGKTDSVYIVFSYGTPVLSVDCSQEMPKLVRHWDGYTPTTLRHINKFLEMLQLLKINKKIWEDMKVFPV